MAKTKLRNSELTAQEVMEIFKKHFGDKYKVYATKRFGYPFRTAADFIIKKSAWSGVQVKLLKRKDGAYLRFAAFPPSVAVLVLFAGLITILILYFMSWRKLEAEVKQFIENASEFRH